MKDPIKDDMDKMFESLFKSLKQLVNEKPNPCDEDQETARAKDKAEKCNELATRLKMRILPYFNEATEDHDIFFGALIKIATSFGVVYDFSEEKQMECFKAMYADEVVNYKKIKGKMDAIKKIMRDE